MKAAIVTIGDEILIGQVIDTNSAFISGELNKAGITVIRIISISDSKDEIFKALDDLRHETDIILMTGGLGPTNDDITKPALAEYFNRQLVLNQKALDHISEFFQQRKIKMNERNRNQAMVPENCRLVPNEYGTAMGLWFEYEKKHLIVMPGVPFEMKAMLTSHILPDLVKRHKLPAIVHRTVHTTGIAESVMADIISEWESNLPQNIKLAYLPSPGILRLRLSASGMGKMSLEHEVSLQVEKLGEILKTIIFGYDGATLEAVAGNLLKQSRKTVAVAESCTGGNIARLLTSVPGSSDYFKGGVVAYANDVKINLLGINKKSIEKHGAVSKPVVTQMAESIKNLMRTDYGIATSGIAGPDGGTREKPVGTVWIALACPDKTLAEIFSFGNYRETNIIRASAAALNMLRLSIIRSSQ
jgi:nicotinamide-nucleotide amidase